MLKEGLGPAYCSGHDDAVAAGTDLSIGSRYAEDSAVVNWRMYRRVPSRGDNLNARVLLGLDPRDANTGFHSCKTESLPALEPRKSAASVFGFLVETAYRATNARYTIAEIPVIFTDRDLGDSKMSLSITCTCEPSRLSRARALKGSSTGCDRGYVAHDTMRRSDNPICESHGIRR